MTFQIDCVGGSVSHDVYNIHVLIDDKMSSNEFKYGIFVRNEVLTDATKPDGQRTALIGHIVKIEGQVGTDKVVVKFLKEDNEWESSRFVSPKDSVLLLNPKLWKYFHSIISPLERVELAKNKELCDKLANLRIDGIVRFIDGTNEYIGQVKHIGDVKGMGTCIGVKLHEPKKNNNCSGSCAGIQYFRCQPGHGIFTTINKILPIDYIPENIEEMDTTGNGYTDPISMRNSFSLQNIKDTDKVTVNTNNDFDQNSCIQNDRTYLLNERKKARNRYEMDLIDMAHPINEQNEMKTADAYTNLKKDTTNQKTENVKMARNRSLNPLSHFMDRGGTMTRRSKFYVTEDGLESKSPPKNDKKINEEADRLAKKSNYLSLPTIAGLTVGSMVEVLNDVVDRPLYGVVRWLGVDVETDLSLAGVELEEEYPNSPLLLTDGVHRGERLFKCAENKALFVPVEQCKKDSRFVDGTPTPVHHTGDTIPEELKNQVIPGAVAPLCMPTEEDVEAVCGKFRGIQGHHNSCYLDVTLFAMFTYTAVFDSLLFRPRNANDIDDYDEVQRVLREEIVNPLRKNLFVSADSVMKLRKLMDKLSSVSGLTSEEKDPEEFLNSLLAQLLKAEPFLKLNSGQEAYYYQLFVEKRANLTLPTVQQLFEQSFLTSKIKLKEVPSCLIIQMPRFGKSYKMYPRILPSQLLDVTDVIEGSPRQCAVCGKVARWECRECFDDGDNLGLENTAFCGKCLNTVHSKKARAHHEPSPLDVCPDFSIMEDHCSPPRLYMELFAVICIETSHYVAFVKCGVGHEAPWCFFDSMADRRGERNGYNIPEMVACRDVSHWLSEERICRQLHEKFPTDRNLPEHARRLLCDAYICMYQSSDVMMYR